MKQTLGSKELYKVSGAFDYNLVDFEATASAEIIYSFWFIHACSEHRNLKTLYCEL
jgi:hypothetical protein